MALLCPVLNSPEDKAKWNELVQKSGSETAAYRMFYRYAHTTDPVGEALSRFDIGKYKIEDKIKDLLAVHGKIRKEEGFDPTTGEPIHNYYDKGTGKLILSVSRALDTNEITRYRGGQSVGSQYSDKGTAIHKVFEMVIRFDGAPTSRENIFKFMQENGIPESFLSTVDKIVSYLRTKGKVLPEMMLADLDSGIAGTGDIIVLGYDGSVLLYDIKTAHRTKNTPKDGKIWDPVNHYDGYKANRYPAQLEFYSRMIERTLGQPVSEKFIIPIEITYKNDDIAQGFEKIEAKGFENVRQYASTELADTIVSNYFNDNRPTKELPKLATIDDSGEMIRAISGRPDAKSSDLDRDADEILDNPSYYDIRQGNKYYYNSLQKKYVKLKDQSNRAMQRRQIIDEFLSKVNTGRDNIDESIRNYLTTGRDAFLDSGEIPSVHIKKMLDMYKGRKNIRVSKLTSIEGFSEKKGWILIEDGDVNAGGTYDLLYLGNDNLLETLNVAKKLKSGDSLFAKFYSSREASLIMGSTLKNNIADSKKFEAALIALKLKEAVPNASFRRILIASTHSGNFPTHYADLYKLLPVVKKFGELKPGLIPTNMKNIFKNPKMFDPNQYRQNMLEAYKAFITIHANSRSRKLTGELIQAYEKEKNGMEQLAYRALEEARDIERAGLSNDPIHNEEMRILRGIYYTVEKIGQEVYPIGWKGGKISMPQNLPPDVIQDITVKMSDALYRIREKFWEGYKKPTEKYFNALFSPFYTPGGIRDAIISDTDRYYEPLLERVTRKAVVGRDENDNSIVQEKTVYSYNLVAEGSHAFKQLTKEQQDFIVMFNDRVQEAMKLMDIEWQRGRIPLVPGSFRNQLYRAYKLGVGSTVTHYQEAIRKMFTEFEASFSDTVKPDSESFAGSSNIFRVQANGPTFDKREDLTGLSEDFVELEKHGKWETNLEIVLDMVMMTAYRSNEMQTVNDILLAAKNHFSWQKTNLFEDRLDANIKWVSDYRTFNVENRDVDAGKWYNKTVRSINQVASFTMLGFSPAIALASTIGQQVFAGSQAISNSLAQNGKYTFKNWNAAFFKIMNPLNWKKVNLLLEQYKLYDQDMSSFMNGLHRYGDKSIFRMKWAYGFLRAGDWLSRSQLLVANMIQDGVWDAYSVNESGELVYDESKDPRDPLLKKTIKANMKKDNPEHVVNGKMQRAYDYNIARSIKAQIDMVLGGYDRETRGMYNAYALGRLFMLFKTYMPSRIDALTSAPFKSRMIGKYELGEDENGNKQYFWKGDQLEGIFHSLNMGMLYLQKLNSEDSIELTTQQKTNITKFVGDFLLIGMTMLAMYAVDDDDDDTKLDDFAAYAMYGAVRDLVSLYNVFGYAEFISTPIALSWIYNSSKRIYNIMMNAADPDSDTLIDTIELHNAVQDYHEIIDYLYEEPSN